jgi:hypothetical protein
MISASADEIMPEPPALDPAPALEEVPVAAFTPEPPGLAPAAAFEEVPVEAESLEPPRIAQELAPGEIAAPVSGPDPVPASPAASVAADEVVVLDCDPEVWMRRLRAKKKDTVHAP